MVWVAWRQHRAQLMLLATLLVLGAATVLLLHMSMSAQLGALPGQGCAAADPAPSEAAGCVAGWDRWHGQWYDLLRAGQLMLVILPVLLGAFAGASLFGREIEQGTHVFAFTQSVGRLRWMATKLAMVLVPSVLVLVVLQWLVNAWVGQAASDALPVSFGSFTYLDTESTGLLPVGYLLLGCAAGAWLGSVWGRALPATISTLIGLVVVRLAAGFGAPWLLPTRLRTFPVAYAAEPPFEPDMLVRWGYVGTGGRQIAAHAPELAGCLSGDEMRNGACFARHGVTGQFAEVIPASSVPALQAIEFTVFAVVAVLLMWATARTLRRVA